MIKNYLAVLGRNFRRNKLYYMLNVCGLSTAFAAAIAILLFASNELSYDQHHEKKDRMYRVIQGGDSDEQSSSVPFPTGPTILNDYGDVVEQATRVFNYMAPALGITTEENGRKESYNEPLFFFADSSYFKIFDHKFLKGNPEKCLSGPGMIVITESMAQKLFHSADPVGKTIKFEDTYPLTVTAVVADVPSTSHFRFDYLASFASLQNLFEKGIPEKNWYWNPVWTYILLKEGKSAPELENQMDFFVKKYFEPSLVDKVHLVIQPVTDIYLKTKSVYEIGPMSDVKHTYILSSIGIFILIVAMINFINLSTAQVAERFKEIGVRKVLGARKRNIATQFMAESVSISFISGVIGLLLLIVNLPWINLIAGKQFSTMDILQPQILAGCMIIVLVCGLFSGTYPAWVLSRLTPVRILKDKTAVGGGGFRQLLVAVQFTVSIILIISTMVIQRQVNFLMDKDLGFEKDQIIVVPVQRTKLVDRYDDFKERIRQNKDIQLVTASNTVVGKSYEASNYKFEGKDEKLYPCLFVRNDFLKTLNIPVLSGRDFTDTITSPGYKVIVNRAFLKEAGWNTPADALGKVIEGTMEGPMPVVGVCEDFNYAPLKETSGAVMIVHTDQTKYKGFFTRYLYVKVNAHNVKPVITFLEKTWSEYNPGSPFEFSFMDDSLGQLYAREENFFTLGKAFGIIAIVIGGLGLWGLSAYYIERRRKEISIRKTLGAGFGHLSLLLSKDFLRSVLISLIIGVPLSYFLITKWLEDFAHRTPLSTGLFVTGGLIVLLCSGAIIFVQLVNGFRTNPAEVLREN
jgi:putative ABC transport system permease protein